jgi:hypothetical protein
MVELRLVIEPLAEIASDEARRAIAARVSDTLHRRLLLRVPCDPVPAATLPRFEMKARRVRFS